MKSLSLFVSNSDTDSSQITEQTFYFVTFSSVESKLQDVSHKLKIYLRFVGLISDPKACTHFEFSLLFLFLALALILVSRIVSIMLY